MHLPGEIYFLISQDGGFEFQNKQGISDKIEEAISRASDEKQSKITDASSIMLMADGYPAKTHAKKRTLSISGAQK